MNIDPTKAILISSKEYMQLNNPQFEGQTSLDKDGNYKMYWSCDKKLYFTQNKL